MFQLLSSKSAFAGLILTILFSPFLFSIQKASGLTPSSLYIITNNENTENRLIKRRTLRAIFSMRTQSWPNGEQLTIFVLADEEYLHESFCQQVLGVLPYQLRKRWDRLIFSGKSGIPIKVSNIDEMKKRVASTHGAIGYIPEGQLDSSIAVVQVK